MTDDYEGERPWTFTGDIRHVVVDLSGEPFVDHDKEAIGMMKRD